MRSNYACRAGFTLIELMIVVAILSILAAVAIPAYIGYIDRSKASEGALNLPRFYNGVVDYYNRISYDAAGNVTSGTLLDPNYHPLVPASGYTLVVPKEGVLAKQPVLGDPEEWLLYQPFGFYIGEPSYYAWYYSVEGVDGSVPGGTETGYFAVAALNFGGLPIFARMGEADGSRVRACGGLRNLGTGSAEEPPPGVAVLLDLSETCAQ